MEFKRPSDAYSEKDEVIKNENCFSQCPTDCGPTWHYWTFGDDWPWDESQGAFVLDDQITLECEGMGSDIWYILT